MARGKKTTSLGYADLMCGLNSFLFSLLCVVSLKEFTINRYPGPSPLPEVISIHNPGNLEKPTTTTIIATIIRLAHNYLVLAV